MKNASLNYKAYIINKNGSIFPMVMMSSIVLSILLVSYYSMTSIDSKLTYKGEDSMKAFWCAEAALEKFKYDLKQGTASTSVPYTDTSVPPFNMFPGTSIQYSWDGTIATAKCTVSGTERIIEYGKSAQSILTFAYYDVGRDSLTSPGFDTFNGVAITPFDNLIIKGNAYIGDNLYFGSTNTNTAINLDTELVGGSNSLEITGSKIFLTEFPYKDAAETIKTGYKFNSFLKIGTTTVKDTEGDFVTSPAGVTPDGTINYTLKTDIAPLTNTLEIPTLHTDFPGEIDKFGLNLDEIKVRMTGGLYLTDQASFYNLAYNRNITNALKVDISQLTDVIIAAECTAPVAIAPKCMRVLYSTKPLIITSATNTFSDIMIVSENDIYIMGNFNTLGGGPFDALIMAGRNIFYLSNTYTFPVNKVAADYKTIIPGGGASYSMVVNAARIDGTRFICSNKWVTADTGTISKYDDTYYIGGGNVFTGAGTVPDPYVFTPPVGNSNLCGVGLLENWYYDTPINPVENTTTLTLRGPTAHLRNATVADAVLVPGNADGDSIPGWLDNDDILTAGFDYYWVDERSYYPPIRIAEYQQHCVDAAGCDFSKYVPKVFNWEVIK